MDDFTSGHGRTFEGDENWLVCPLELADSLASKGMLPKGAAVYSPDAAAPCGSATTLPNSGRCASPRQSS